MGNLDLDRCKQIDGRFANNNNNNNNTYVLCIYIHTFECDTNANTFAIVNSNVCSLSSFKSLMILRLYSIEAIEIVELRKPGYHNHSFLSALIQW